MLACCCTMACLMLYLFLMPDQIHSSSRLLLIFTRESPCATLCLNIPYFDDNIIIVRSISNHTKNYMDSCGDPINNDVTSNSPLSQTMALQPHEYKKRGARLFRPPPFLTSTAICDKITTFLDFNYCPSSHHYEQIHF